MILCYYIYNVKFQIENMIWLSVSYNFLHTEKNML